MARTATYKTAAQGQMIHVLPQSFVYRLTPRYAATMMHQ